MKPKGGHIMTGFHLNKLGLTRRGFLGGTAATIGLGTLPSGALAQGAQYRRFEITDPAIPPNIIPSYKAAVAAMLELDADDPRNWYRHAIVHLLDCPHANWWFLPWHRAYLGWFEQICRELSKDPYFTLPYWDWTKTPKVPAAMFEDALDPNNTGFILTANEFRTEFEPVISALYASFSQDQKDQIAQRMSVNTEAMFWSTATRAFFPQPNSRGLTAANADLDTDTQATVHIDMIRRALHATAFSDLPTDSAGFGSPKTAAHSIRASEEGILESQPHDNVHGALGGFMLRFLSPTDPIFFLHHGNLDRLWDVWTRRQEARSQPTLPGGADLAPWSDEAFLFFSGPDGQPVASPNTKAGVYAEMALFDYDYSPGSGEEEVAVAVAALPTPAAAFAPVTAQSAGAGAATDWVASVPSTALAAAATPEAPPLVAKVTLNLDEDDVGRRFRVLVTPPGAAEPVLAGAITIFAHNEPGPNSFSVPLPSGLAAGAAAGGNVDLNISVEEIVNLEPAFAPLPSPAAAGVPELVAGITVVGG